jgi:DNA-binding NarL/FixJ family response regulator
MMFLKMDSPILGNAPASPPTSAEVGEIPPAKEYLMSRRARVFVVDDHPLILSGVRLLLEPESDLELVGVATNGKSACRQCVHLQPDVLILDLQIPGTSPLDILTTVHQQSPRTKTLVMSAFLDRTYIKELQHIGIDGYILKDEAHDLLLTAIRTVLRDATWFSHPVFHMLVSPTPPSDGQLVWKTLTKSEKEVLLGIGRGLSNKQIAAEIHLSEQTVRNYSSILYEKLGIASRAQVVIWLHQHHIFELIGTPIQFKNYSFNTSSSTPCREEQPSPARPPT